MSTEWFVTQVHNHVIHMCDIVRYTCVWQCRVFMRDSVWYTCVRLFDKHVCQEYDTHDTRAVTLLRMCYSSCIYIFIYIWTNLGNAKSSAESPAGAKIDVAWHEHRVLRQIRTYKFVYVCLCICTDISAPNAASIFKHTSIYLHTFTYMYIRV